jgi:hypothetical protein
MDAINARSIEDRLTDEFSTMMPHLMFLYFTCATQRPSVGYCITTTSDFSREKFSSERSTTFHSYLISFSFFTKLLSVKIVAWSH